MLNIDSHSVYNNEATKKTLVKLLKQNEENNSCTKNYLPTFLENNTPHKKI